MYCKRIKDFFCFPLFTDCKRRCSHISLASVSSQFSKFCRNSVGGRIVKFEGPREIKA